MNVKLPISDYPTASGAKERLQALEERGAELRNAAGEVSIKKSGNGQERKDELKSIGRKLEQNKREMRKTENEESRDSRAGKERRVRQERTEKESNPKRRLFDQRA